MASGVLIVVVTVVRVLGAGSGVCWGGAPEVRSLVTAWPGLCRQVVALQGSSVLRPRASSHYLVLPHTYWFLPYFLISNVGEHPFVQTGLYSFLFCVLTAHILCPFSSWAVSLFFYWFVANFNILKLNPLLRVYVTDISSQAGACLFTMLALSLVTGRF